MRDARRWRPSSAGSFSKVIYQKPGCANVCRGYLRTFLSLVSLLYSQLFANTAYGVNFYDVTTGSNGHAAGAGYDQCTGIGSPRGHLGK